jgi:RNA polymerase sigma factor (sigma-70 family)
MGTASDMNNADLQVFEEVRPRLLGLAYRLLGSRADAEDCVQDCFLKWRYTDRTEIRTPLAWLSSVCTRRSLDVLRGADRKRLEYVGPWLPEPIHPLTAPSVESKLAMSLTMAFLLLLERLTPKERAAYLLYEIFDQSYAEIAAVLESKRQSNPSVQRLGLMVKLEDERRTGGAERTSAEPGRSRASGCGIRGERAESAGVLREAWTDAGDAGSVPAASAGVAGSIRQQVGSCGVIRQERTGQRAGGGAVERTANRSKSRV